MGADTALRIPRRRRKGLTRLHQEFISGNGLRMTGKHHEIYLSDFLRAAHPTSSAPFVENQSCRQQNRGPESSFELVSMGPDVSALHHHILRDRSYATCTTGPLLFSSAAAPNAGSGPCDGSPVSGAMCRAKTR